MRKIIAVAFIVCFSPSLFAYNKLNVIDPHGWYYEDGKISEACLTVTPKGLFFRYDLELKLCAMYNNYEGNQLEIEYFFDLPEGSMIIESYLWVGDSLVRAELRDSWSANAIYESIVQRRRDPSVLNKIGDNSYELRVYPLLKEECRSVIISYYAPAAWSGANYMANVPVDMLMGSAKNIRDLHIYVKNLDYQKKPILQKNDLTPFAYKGSVNGGYWEKTTSVTSNSPINIIISSPVKNGIYLSTYNTGENEGVYQLALLPDKYIKTRVATKVLYVVDYDVEHTTLSKADLFATIRQSISGNLTETDSFNVVYSNLNNGLLSEKWIAASDVNINETFGNFNIKNLANYSLLPATITKALEYLQKGQAGEIIVITSSNGEGEYKEANALISDLLSLTSYKPAIHSVSVSDFNIMGFFQGGIYYQGDEYFLSLLSQKTGGDYFNILNNKSTGLLNILNLAISRVEGNIKNADVFTDCDEGFCYGRQYLYNLNDGININTPILQIGKFIGNTPFYINFSGLYQSNAFSKDIVLSANDIEESDESLIQFCAGLNIANLEKTSLKNEIITQIMNTSTQNHVLSRYTTFLALEPDMNVEELEENEEEEFFPVNVEKVVAKTHKLEASPNPFSTYIEINIEQLQDIISENSTMEIINVMGQVVKSFDLSKTSGSITWDGLTDDGQLVERGVYFIVLKTNTIIFNIKIVKQ